MKEFSRKIVYTVFRVFVVVKIAGLLFCSKIIYLQENHASICLRYIKRKHKIYPHLCNSYFHKKESRNNATNQRTYEAGIRHVQYAL